MAMEVTELAISITTDALSGDFENNYIFQNHSLMDRDGICVKESEMKSCLDSDDCNEDQFCIVGYCGERVYFDAIQDIQCRQDSVCQVHDQNVIYATILLSI